MNSFEKRVLEELARPYAIMDMQGRMIWCNKQYFAQLTGKRSVLTEKNINTIFPDITPMYLYDETEVKELHPEK